jgi:hypothetical protein
VNARRGVRLGLLAIGCGAGIAAYAPLASADTSTDSWGLAELGLAAAAQQIIVEPNLAISFDGYSLQEGTATANTTSGDFGLAIAYGSGAHADASGGFGDLAVADGTDSAATTAGSNGVGAGTLDVAVANGTGSHAEADGGYLDAAFANGGAYAIAGAGDGGGTAHVGDVASASGDASVAFAGQGDFNSALANGETATAEAGLGNSNVAVADNPPGTSVAVAFSQFGNGNVASVWGGHASFAEAGGNDFSRVGDHDIATVIGDNSGAISGASPTAPGSYDLGAVLFDNGGSSDNAVGGDYLYDVVTALGNETGSAAATSGTSFFSESASLF